MQHGRPQRSFLRGPALLIVAAVFVWGSYIAVGAATNESKDVRKAAMIMASTIAFLLFWMVVLFRRHESKDATGDVSSGSSGNEQYFGRWNVSSVYSLASSLVSTLLVSIVYFVPDRVSDLTAGRLLLAALVVAGSSMIAAVVGLSRPTVRRGHRWAFAALLVLLVAFALAVAALRNSVRKADRLADTGRVERSLNSSKGRNFETSGLSRLSLRARFPSPNFDP